MRPKWQETRTSRFQYLCGFVLTAFTSLCLLACDPTENNAAKFDAFNTGQSFGVDGAAITPTTINPPVIVFPTSATIINQALSAANFPVFGSCDSTGANSGVAVFVDGQPAAGQTVGTCNGNNWSVAIDTTSLTSGSHAFAVALNSATDNRSSLKSTAVAVTQDVTPPTVAFTNTFPTQLQGGQTLNLTFSATDSQTGIASLKLDWAADGVSFSPVSTLSNSATSFSYLVPSSNVGAARLRLTATDGAGNTQTALSPAMSDVTSGVTLVSVGSSSYLAGGSTASITWNTSGIALASTPINLYYSTDGGTTWTEIATHLADSGSYAWSVPTINSSTVKVKVTAADTSGDIFSSISATDCSIDSTPPTVLGVAVQSSLSVNVYFSEALISSGALTPANYSISGSGKGTLAANPTSVTYGGGNLYNLTWSSGNMYNGGDIVVNVSNATDLAGNVINSTYTQVGGAIGILPIVTGLTNYSTPVTSQTWNWGCSESSCTYRYAVDLSSSWTATGTFSSTVTASQSTGTGTYYLHVQAQDAAGNLSVYTSVSSVLNNSPPPAPSSIALVNPASSPSNVQTPTFLVSGVTSGYTITLHDGDSSCGASSAVGSGAASATTISLTSYTLAQATHTITAQATDTLGNTVCSSASYTYVVDLSLPYLTSVSVQSGTTIDVTFNTAMGTGVTTATNYTISGSGQGSFASNPSTVSLVSGNTYALVWSSGNMFQGGNVVIHAVTALDTAGNAVNSTYTQVGGAIQNYPTLSFTAPTVSNVITSSNESSILVEGSCTTNGQAVTIVAAISSYTVTATPTCYTANANQFSTTMNLTSLSDGTVTFSASEGDGSGNVGHASSVSVLKQAMPPNAATGLAWSPVGPTTTTTVAATWTVSSSASLSDQQIQLYTGSTCGATSGSPIDLSSATKSSYSFTPGDGVYSFKLTSSDVYSNSSITACSPGIVIDTTAPTTPSLALSTPTNGTTSAYSLATVTGTSGSDAGSTSAGTNVTVSLYLNDSTCSATSIVGAVTIAPSTAFTLTTSTLGNSGDGLKTLYYKTSDALNNATTCASASLSYTFQANPNISFVNMGTTIQESGTQVGTPLQIQRDECGIQSTVTITTSDVSAFSGTNYYSVTAGYTFAANNCSSTITIPASIFSVTNDGVETGDLFFRVGIYTVTGGVAYSMNQAAQVNIVDTSYPGDFMFAQPLWTVADNGGAITITAQRGGSTAAAATVVAQTTDGSAVSGTDYTGGSYTISFAASAAEETFTIPVTSYTTTGANKSFLLRLVSPSTGTNVRPFSVAKVRIMNHNGDGNTCTYTATPFGGGAGTSGSPYLICTKTQWEAVNSYATSNFLQEADITADSSLVPAVSITGNINGNEYMIENFRFNGSNSYPSLLGVIGSTSAYTVATSISAFNLVNASVIATNSITVGGLFAQTNTYPQNLSNILVSGYVKGIAGGLGSGLLAGEYGASGVSTLSASNVATVGTASIAASVPASGMIGELSSTVGAVFNLSHLYAGVNVPAGTAVGGVIGSLSITAGTLTLSDGDNRGYLNSAAAGVGGIVGKDFGTTAAGGVTYSNCANYAYINGAGNVGGIVGLQTATTTDLITDTTNYGTIKSTGADVGGIVGEVTLATASGVAQISNVTNTAAISMAGAYAQIGGIIGFVTATASITSLQISGAKNSGLVASGANNVGGILGYFNTSGAATGITLTIVSSSNSGLIAGGQYVGGAVGNVDFNNTGTLPTNNIATFTGVSNTGTIATYSTTGTRQYYGGLFGQLTSQSTTADVAFSIIGCSSTTGTVGYGYNYTSSTWTAGGLIGEFATNGGNNNTSLISGSYSSNSISAYENGGGLVGLTSQGTGTSTLVFLNDYYTGANAGYHQSGGLIAQVQNPGGTFSIIHSYSTGNVAGGCGYNGGLIGLLTVGGSPGGVSILDSYSTGEAYGLCGANGAGGMIGTLEFASSTDTVTIQDSYSTGTVKNNGAAAGGIIGNTYTNVASASGTINLTRVYTTSYVTYTGAGATNLGGFIGETTGGITVNTTDSFWDSTINPNLPTDGNQLSTTTLHTSTPYTNAGWTFGGSSPWATFVNGAFPTLQ